MLQRLLSTLVLWTVVLGGLWYFGAHAAVWLLTLLGAFTLHEFYALTEKMGHRPFRWLGLTTGALMTAAPFYLAQYFTGGEEIPDLAPALLAFAVVIACALVLYRRDPPARAGALAATLLGLLYVPFMLHYLARVLLLYDDPNAGLVPCLWIVVVAKFCDVGALFTGLVCGRHLLAPTISPKKTWEGAVGGVLFASGTGAAFAYFAVDYLPEGFTPFLAALVAAPLAIIAIVSDLIESVLKRHSDLKDTGGLIPGIGGVFDLTDSLILTAPVGYLVFLFLS